MQHDEIPDMWFLDLEETIITEFYDPCLMNTNVEAIRELFQRLGVTQAGIFSFAIDHEADLKRFRTFQKWLEGHVGVEFVEIPTVNDLMREILWKTGTVWELFEFRTIWGKGRAFTDFCNIVHPNRNCFLIDDVVENTITINRQTKTKIELIRVETLVSDGWEKFGE